MNLVLEKHIYLYTTKNTGKKKHRKASSSKVSTWHSEAQELPSRTKKQLLGAGQSWAIRGSCNLKTRRSFIYSNINNYIKENEIYYIYAYIQEISRSHPMSHSP